MTSLALLLTAHDTHAFVSRLVLLRLPLPAFQLSDIYVQTVGTAVQQHLHRKGQTTLASRIYSSLELFAIVKSQNVRKDIAILQSYPQQQARPQTWFSTSKPFCTDVRVTFKLTSASYAIFVLIYHSGAYYRDRIK